MNPVNRFSAPPEGASDSPEIAAAWIAANVPSVEGTLPKEWKKAVYREASRYGVKLSTVTTALPLTRKYGHRFAIIQPKVDWNPNQPTQAEWRSISDGEVVRRYQYTLAKLESNFKLAQAMNDISGMEAALAAALKIAWELAKGYAKVREARRLQHMVEYEEFMRAVREGFREAEMLGTHLRRLTREDLARLREAPTPLPSGVSYRIVNQVTSRRPVRSSRR